MLREKGFSFHYEGTSEKASNNINLILQYRNRDDKWKFQRQTESIAARSANGIYCCLTDMKVNVISMEY